MQKVVFSILFLTILGIVVAAALLEKAARADETSLRPALATNVDSKERGATNFSDGKIDPLRRNASGIQTFYPAVAKIVGRGAAEEKEDGAQAIPLYYGSGTYVAENGEFGLVLTNWHVVSESNESIDVIFPNFSSPAKIVLRDEIWDLAALIIRKPPNLAPIPIALEVPEIGETLWVAGYGQSGGLADFQIQSGQLLNYVELFEPKDLPVETLAVGRGVRQGDSGGPIFNRYGEIAGILWGSDGKVTMGTFCVRAQVFLTEAFQRLTVIYAENTLDAPNSEAANDFLFWNTERFNVKTAESKTSSEVLVKKRGVLPISQGVVYVSADAQTDADALGKAKRGDALQFVKNAALNFGKNSTVELPPSPPIFSPTFVVQQRSTNRTRPEVAESDFYNRWNESALAEAANVRLLNSSVTNNRPPILTGKRESTAVVRFQNAASNPAELSDSSPDSPVENEEGDSTAPALNAETSPSTLESVFGALVGNNVSAPGAKGRRAPAAISKETQNDSSKTNGSVKGIGLENAKIVVGAVSNVEQENAEKIRREETASENVPALRPVDWNALSGWQIYVVICGMFCLFYNAGRLLAPPKKRREKPEVAEARQSSVSQEVVSISPKRPTDV